MNEVAAAFGFLGWIVNLNGRRLLRAEMESKMLLHLPDPNDSSRFQPMGTRKVRKAVSKLMGRPFRPVYFHQVRLGEHKQYVKTMKRRVFSKVGNKYPHEAKESES